MISMRKKPKIKHLSLEVQRTHDIFEKALLPTTSVWCSFLSFDDLIRINLVHPFLSNIWPKPDQLETYLKRIDKEARKYNQVNYDQAIVAATDKFMEDPIVFETVLKNKKYLQVIRKWLQIWFIPRDKDAVKYALEVEKLDELSSDECIQCFDRKLILKNKELFRICRYAKGSIVEDYINDIITAIQKWKCLDEVLEDYDDFMVQRLSYWRIALEICCHFGVTKRVISLMECAEQDWRCEFIDDAVKRAAIAGHTEIVENLLKYHHKKKKKYSSEDESEQDEEEEEEEDEDDEEEMVGFSLHMFSMWSERKHHCSCCKALVSASQCNDSNKATKILEIILGFKGVKICKSDLSKACENASEKNHDIFIEKLLKWSTTNMKGMDDWFVLNLAASGGHKVLLKKMINKIQPSINSTRTRYFFAPLSSAVLGGHSECVLLILNQVKEEIPKKHLLGNAMGYLNSSSKALACMEVLVKHPSFHFDTHSTIFMDDFRRQTTVRALNVFMVFLDFFPDFKLKKYTNLVIEKFLKPKNLIHLKRLLTYKKIIFSIDFTFLTRILNFLKQRPQIVNILKQDKRFKELIQYHVDTKQEKY
jgi:hypothetical protein